MILKKKSSAVRSEFSLKKDFKKNYGIYLLALPVFAFYVIFKYLPMYGILIGFKDFGLKAGESFFSLVITSEWVGFEYFKDFFSSYYFWQLLRNTLVMSFSSLVFVFPMPIIFALLVNEIRSKKFSAAVKTISYIPHFISLVVICGMIRAFVGQDGMITSFLGLLGMENSNMLNKPELFVPIYIISDLWQSVGWSSIIYIAAIAGVDQTLYEAASIDGAGRWKQTIHITIPSIAPTIILLLIMKIGNILNVGYEKIILLYNPITYETADVISSFVYRKGIIDADWSYSTAVNMFNSLVNVTLLICANYVSKKYSETSLW